MPRKKKTEVNKENIEKETMKEIEKAEETIEEFPNTDIAIDVFASQDGEKVEESEKDRRKRELLEKAKKLAEKIEVKPEKEIKEELEEAILEDKKKKETLIPINDYVKSGIYIGTKVITPHMRPYVYRRRADGIAILNTSLIDEKLKEAAKFLADYSIENMIVVCKREAGWRAVKLFSEITGIRVFTKKYPAGIITNIDLPNFFETELVVICDPWLDRNALNDAVKVKRKVMALCDTNNLTFGVDFVLPCNNKSNKSLGVVFHILAREYVKAKKIDKKVPDMEDFIGEKLEDLPKRN